jgi:biopolymer transport protein ExbD
MADRFSRAHHDPHAHVIHKPGRRLMHHVPLKFVWNRVTGHTRRGSGGGLNLVSFIDFLIVTVIFLLMSFSASGEMAVDKNVKLPKAENVLDIIEAPVVAVNGTMVLVDGAKAGDTRAIEDSGQMQPIEELRTLLVAKRELWKKNQPNKPFPGVLILQVDSAVKAAVVKSVFRTATFAGYQNLSFMVGKLPKSN